MRNKFENFCPYCKSTDISKVGTEDIGESENPLVLLLFCCGFAVMLFLSLCVTKLYSYSVGAMLLILSIIGFVFQRSVSKRLNKKIVVMYVCNECNRSWSE